MKKANSGKTRVQFELNEASMSRLQELKSVTDASSYADVTKNAYKLYERLINYSENGYHFIVEKDGKQKEIEFFL